MALASMHLVSPDLVHRISQLYLCQPENLETLEALKVLKALQALHTDPVGPIAALKKQTVCPMSPGPWKPRKPKTIGSMRPRGPKL